MRLSNTGAKSNTPRQQKEHTHILLLISMRLLKTGDKSNTPLQQKEENIFVVDIHEIVKHRINQILLSSIREATNMNTVGDIGDIVRGGQGQAQRPVGKDGKKANQGQNFVPKYLWIGGC